MEAHAAIHRAQHRVHAWVAEHTPEVGLVVVHFQLVVQQHFQHHVQCLVEQPTLDGVVVELQERLDQFLGILEALHCQADQQLQFKNGQLAPDRVFVEFHADQRGDGGVVIDIAVVQALEQQLEGAVVEAVQVEDIGAERQGAVGVVPDQVLHRVDFRVTRHQDAAGGGAKVVVHCHVHLLAQVFEDAEQGRGLLHVGILAMAGEVPLDELEVGLGAEEAPRHHAAGVDEMLDEVVRLGQRVAFEGRLRQVVQALEAAPLEQFGKAALQRHFQARMGTERGKYTTGTRVHQGHAHDRERAAQRSILDQHREALLLQALDAGNNGRVLGQYLLRHIRQAQLAFEDFALHRPFEDFRQALHLRFGQGIAGAHAVAEEQVLDQVGREVHHLLVGLAHERQRADTTGRVARVGVVQVRTAQLAVRVVDGQAVLVENLDRQRVPRARFEPLLVRVVHERRVGQVLTPVLVVIEEVAVQALDEFAQRRGQRGFLGRALAVRKAHWRLGVAHMQRPHVGHDVAPRSDLDLHPQPGQDARHVGDGLLQRQVLAGDVGTGVRHRHQQALGIGIEVVDHFDDELGAGLYHLLHGAAVDGTQDALAVLLGDVLGQLDLDLEDLVVAVFRVDDVVLRQANVFGRDVAGLAVQLDEVSRAQGRGRQEIVERPRGRAITFVTDRLVGDHREVVELGFETEIVEKIDLDFHAGLP